VNEVEIDVLDAELVEAGVEGAQSRVGALVRAEQLRGDKDIFAGRPLARQSAAYCGFVLVDLGGVDGAIVDFRAWRTGASASALATCQRLNPSWGMARPRKREYRVEFVIGETTTTDQSRSTAAPLN